MPVAMIPEPYLSKVVLHGFTSTFPSIQNEWSISLSSLVSVLRYERENRLRRFQLFKNRAQASVGIET